jgi:hypothetical protein
VAHGSPVHVHHMCRGRLACLRCWFKAKPKTARMLADVPGSGEEGVTVGELVQLVREDIVLETISDPSPSSMFYRSLGGGLLMLLMKRKETDEFHWCFFLPGVGFWDRKYGGAKPPVVGDVNAWLDALGYQPLVEHAFTPVILLSKGRVVRRLTAGKKRGSYIPDSLLQCSRKGKRKGIHASVQGLLCAPPTPPNIQLKVGQWGSLNFNGMLCTVRMFVMLPLSLSHTDPCLGFRA